MWQIHYGTYTSSFALVFWSEQKTKFDGAHDKLILRPVLMIISFVVGGWAESGAAVLQPEVFCGTQSRLGPLQHQAWSQGTEFNTYLYNHLH